MNTRFTTEADGRVIREDGAKLVHVLNTEDASRRFKGDYHITACPSCVAMIHHSKAAHAAAINAATDGGRVLEDGRTVCKRVSCYSEPACRDHVTIK